MFSLEYDSFHFLLENSWLKQLWKFTAENKIRFINRCTELPLPQREGDVFLMEEFQAQGYSTEELMKLNKCRIYLKVMRLADIMTGTGDSFTEHYLCIREQEPRNSYIWPRKEEPSSVMKKLWKKALQKTFGLRVGYTTYKLGKWLNNDHDNWRWFYNPNTQNLYKKRENQWRLWSRITTRGRQGASSKFKYHSNCIDPSTGCNKATVQHCPNNTVIFTGHNNSHRDTRTTYSSHQCDNSMQLRILHNNLHIPSFKQALEKEKLLAVCDGSFLPDTKTSAAA